MEFYDATNTQSGIYLINKNYNNVVLYNIQAKITLHEKVDHRRLEEAFNNIINKYDLLRSSLIFQQEKLQIRVNKEYEFAIEFKSFIDVDDKHGCIEGFIKKDLNTPLKLSDTCLLRVQLLQMDVEKFYLICTYPHSLMCGNSGAKILKEIFDIYDDNKNIRHETLYTHIEVNKRTVKSTQFNSCAMDGNSDLMYLYQKYNEIPPIGSLSNTNKITNISYQTADISFGNDKKLRQFCRKYRVSEYILHQLGFIYLLTKYVNNDELGIGVVRGTTSINSFSEIGVLIKVLPVLLNIKNKDLYTLLKLLKNQSKSHKKIMKEGGGSAIDNYQFVLDYKPKNLQSALSVYSQQWESRDVEFTCKTHYPFYFELIKCSEYWQVKLYYDATLYSKDLAIRFIENYKTTIIGLLENSHEEMKNYDYLSSREYDLLRKLGRGSKNPIAHLRFEEYIQQKLEENNSEGQFLKSGGEKHRKDKLLSTTSTIFNNLISNNIKDHDKVIVLCERTVYMPALILAILKVGATYVPVDVKWPLLKIKKIISLTNPNAVILNSVVHKTEFECIDVTCIEIEDLLLEENIYNNVRQVPTNNIAYIIYTSGTSGEPKGIKIKHESLLNVIDSFSKEISVRNQDTLFSSTSFAFDISMLELFLPLAVGANLYIADREEVEDIRILVYSIKKVKPTIIQGTPTLFSLLTQMNWLPSTFQTLLVGGEDFPYNLKEKLLENAAKVYNLYGPTETTIWSMCKEFTTRGGLVTIGKPINNTDIAVVSLNNELLPIGAIGELVIGGKGVLAGYTSNKCHDNLMKFSLFSIDDPFYKTGDLVKWENHEEIRYIARSSSELKLNGYRIDLSEIRLYINSSTHIHDSVVIIHNKRLIAFIVVELESAKKFSEARLVNFIRKHLPEYQVPQDYIVIENIPLNSNGKIDYDRLIELSYCKSQYHNDLEVISRKNKSDLLEIMRKNKKLHTISERENILSRGLSSIELLSVLSEINRKFHLEIRLIDIINYPTVEKLSNLFLRNHGKNHDANTDSQLVEEDLLKLSFSASEFQRQIWLSELKNSQSPMVSIRLEFNSNDFHSNNIEDCIVSSIISHPILLAEFTLNDTNLTYSLKDDYKNRPAIIRELLKCNGGFSFSSIHDWPLSRYNLSSLNNVFYIELFFHHIIFDGISSVIFLTDLIDRLENRKSLIDLDIAYFNWSYNNSRLSDSALTSDAVCISGLANSQRIFWNEDPEQISFDELEYQLNISELDCITKELNITHVTFFLYVYLKIIQDTFDFEVATVAIPIDVRDTYNIEAVGPFMKTAIFFLNKDEHISFEQVSKFIVNVISNRDCFSNLPSGQFSEPFITDQLTIDFHFISHNVSEKSNGSLLKKYNISVKEQSSLYKIALFVSTLDDVISLKVLCRKNALSDENVLSALKGGMDAYIKKYDLSLQKNSTFSRDIKMIQEKQVKNEKRGIITEIESIHKRLIIIWKEILFIDHVDGNSDFFKLGGSSIKIVSLQNKINIQFGIYLPFNELYKNSEFDEQVKIIARSITKKPDDTNQLVMTHNSPGGLTEAQMAYLLGRGEHFVLGNIGAHIYQEWFVEQLDVDKFEQALNKVIQRHDLLMSYIDGEKCVRLDKAPPYTVPNYSISTEGELNNLRNKLSHKIYNPLEWPLFEVSTVAYKNSYIIITSIDLLIADAFSFRIILDEIDKYYLSLESELDSLKNSFNLYLKELNNLNTRKLINKSKQYWDNQIIDLKPGPCLPTLCEPQKIRKVHFSRCSRTLSPSLLSMLKDKARCNKVSVTTILLYCYIEILRYWSNKREFTINLTVFDRKNSVEDTLSIVGDFTSVVLLPVSSDMISANMSISDKLKRVASALWQSLDNRWYSGINVHRDYVKLHNLDKNINYMPVVFTSILDEDSDRFNENTLFHRMGYGISQTPQVSLDFKAYEFNNELVIEWDYVEQLYPDSMIQDMHGTYCELLQSLIHNDWSGVFFPQLPKYQIDQISTFNNTSEKYLTCTLNEQIMNSFKLFNNEIVLISDNTRVTYHELENIIESYCHILSNNKVENNFIAIILPKSKEQFYAAIASTVVGKCFIPINFEWPLKRIISVINDCLPGLIITTKEMESELEKYLPCHIKGNILFVSDLRKRAKETFDLQTYVNPVNPNDTAYIIYTSGTTGVPKGVEITHGGATNTINAIVKMLHLSRHDVFLNVSDFSFDLTIFDFFVPLYTGGSLVIPLPSDTNKGDILLKYVEEYKVTVWNSVPMLMNILIEAGANFPHTESSYQSLKYILLSGDKISPDLVRRCYRCLNKGAQVYSLGGATECSIWSIYLALDKSIDVNIPVPYGKPLANQEIYILDEEDDICPFYTVGEICIAGEGLAKGYYKDKFKTDAAFTQSPALKKRIYRTGDIGFYNPSGYIEIMGRDDNQVKISGFRVELEDINRTLESHDKVSNAYTLQCMVEQKQYLASFYIPSRIKKKCIADKLKFSLAFFSNELSNDDKVYHQFLECIKFADTHGFHSVWLPERHFHQVGGIFPNPTILASALSTYTDNINIRAGSIVAPLHNPIRLAEDWACVDNLSGGRVGLAFASGWHPNDFVLAPEKYADRKVTFLEDLKVFKTLWEGHTATFQNGVEKEHLVKTYPRPIQEHCPIWLTVAKDRTIFEAAGEIGANIYTSLLNQNLSELEENIRFYRTKCDERSISGHVTLMLHAYIAESSDTLLPEIEAPLAKYLKTHINLLQTHTDAELELNTISEEDLQKIINRATERFIKNSSFIGTIEECVNIAGKLIDIGVDELALLVDFGLSTQQVVKSLERVSKVSASDVTDIHSRESKNDVEKIKYLQQRLPKYMVPNIVMPLQNIPLNINNKVDNKALKEMVIYHVGKSTPQNAVKLDGALKELADIWCEVLEINNISTDKNFFTLGGNSLYALQVINYTNKKFNIHLPVSTLFENPNLKDFFKIIENEKQQGYQRLENDELAQHGNVFPLSIQQNSQWMLNKLSRNNTSYNDYLIFECDLKTDIHHINDKLKDIVQYNDIFRTRFSEDGKWQIIDEEFDYSTIHRENIATTYLIERLNHLVNVKFNLTEAPLYRFSALISERKIYLVFVMHHSITDGASWLMLVNYVFNDVTLISKGHEQYKYFVSWQDQLIKNAIFNSKINKISKNLPCDMRIETNYFVDSNISGGIVNIYEKVPDKQIRGLYQIASKNECTSYCVLLTLTQVALASFLNKPNIHLLTPFHGRIEPRLKNIMGCMSNIHLMFQDISIYETFKQLLTANKKYLNNVQTYQEVPTSFYCEEVQSLIFSSEMISNQILLSMQPLLTANKHVKQFFDMNISTPARVALEINLVSGQTEQASYIYCKVDKKTLSEDIAKTIVEYILKTLDFVANESDLSKVYINELMSGKILSGHNYEPIDTSICEYLAHLSVNYNDKVAIYDDNGSISYNCLLRSSINTAKNLFDMGIMPKSTVGLYFPKSITFFKIMLGLFKLNCPVLFMDSQWPEKYIISALETSKASAVIVSKELEGLRHNITQIVVNSELFSESNTTLPDIIYDGSDAVYKIFTSGSTGQPKCVDVIHRSLLNTLLDQTDKLALQKGDNMISVSKTSFDAFIYEWGIAFLSGASLYLPSKRSLVGETLAKIIENEKITAAVLTPSVLYTLQDCFPKCLRLIVSAGEKLDIKFYQSLSDKTTIINAYGLSETSICITSNHELKLLANHVSVGKPIKNISIVVLSDQLKIQAPYCLGNIYVSSMALAGNIQQLYDRSKFWQCNDELFFKTGDFGFYDNQGYLYITGRDDGLIKLYGNRVSKPFIENKIKSLLNIYDLVIISEDDNKVTNRLCLIIDKKINTKLTRFKMLNLLKKSLPSYMVPQNILINNIPLTANKKIDYTKLHAMAFSRQNAIEQVSVEYKQIAEAFSESLLVDKNNLHLSFRELGGDSIKAMLLSARLKELNLDVEPLNILETKSIRELIELNLAAEINKSLTIPILPNQAWFLSKVNVARPESQVWFQYTTLTVNNNVDELTLKNAVLLALEMHLALRTLFGFSNGVWQQEIDDTDIDEYYHTVTCPSDKNNLKDFVNEFLHNAIVGYKKSSLFVSFNHDAKRYLTILISHLSIDGYSWFYLLKFLDQAIGKILNSDVSIFHYKQDHYKDVYEAIDIRSTYELAVNNYDCSSIDSKKATLTNNSSVSFSLGAANTISSAGNIKNIRAALFYATFKLVKILNQSSSVSFIIEAHGRNEYPILTDTICWLTKLHYVTVNDSVQLTVDDIIRSLEEILSGPGDYISDSYAGKDVNFNFLGDFNSSLLTNFSLTDFSFDSICYNDSFYLTRYSVSCGICDGEIVYTLYAHQGDFVDYDDCRAILIDAINDFLLFYR